MNLVLHAKVVTPSELKSSPLLNLTVEKLNILRGPDTVVLQFLIDGTSPAITVAADLTDDEVEQLRKVLSEITLIVPATELPKAAN